MAGRKLAVNVQVGNDLHVAGSTPDQETAEQITNPKAWADEVDEASKPSKPRAKRS